MTHSMTRRTVLAGALPVAALALSLSACGSSSSNGYNTTPTSSPTSSGEAEIVGTTSGPMGTYLTGDDGRAVYLWVADHGATSQCTNACASVWPPVTTDGAPKATGGVKASDLGTIKRSDGTTQVTYQGHPLYYYAPDTAKGQTTGQGSNSFGAKWWLVSPAGSAITGSMSPASSGGSGW